MMVIMVIMVLVMVVVLTMIMECTHANPSFEFFLP